MYDKSVSNNGTEKCCYFMTRSVSIPIIVLIVIGNKFLIENCAFKARKDISLPTNDEINTKNMFFNAIKHVFKIVTRIIRSF